MSEVVQQVVEVSGGTTLVTAPPMVAQVDEVVLEVVGDVPEVVGRVSLSLENVELPKDRDNSVDHLLGCVAFDASVLFDGVQSSSRVEWLEVDR